MPVGRRRWAAAGLAALLVTAGAVASGGAATGMGAGGNPGERPNVVVVMTDDQRADEVRVMPQVRRLIGHRGTTFRNAFATFPLCCPSRASYLTGQYAHNHGVLSNVPPSGGVERLDEQDTVPLALQGAGYRTGWLGKYLNGYHRIAPHVPPGYDEWRVRTGDAQRFGWSQVINGGDFRWGRTPRDYQTDVLARQAKSFIRASAGSEDPFFLTISPDAPHRENHARSLRHDPRAAPRHRGLLEGTAFPKTKAFNERNVADKPAFVRNRPRFRPREVRRIERQRLARLESLLAVDDLVNSVVRTLSREGELDDTLVLFTSDNGHQMGEHRLYQKSVIYEESTRVPLLIRGPGIPRGRTVSTLAANMDVPATIYDVADVAPAVPQDGVSLFELLADPEAFRDRALMFHAFATRAVRTRRYVYAEHDSDPGYQDGELELYDLATDPTQRRSAHEKPALAGVRAELADRLDELRGCAGASCR